MTELINFRDFGGLETEDGSSICLGRLYRCGHLGSLSARVACQLIEMDFAVVVDLRHPAERQRQVSPWTAEQQKRIVSHHGLSGAEAPHIEMLKAGPVTADAIRRLALRYYRELPYDADYRPLFARTFLQMAASDGCVLIHCTAGKDRTGVQVALILRALGASRAAVVQEYMRSLKAPGLDGVKLHLTNLFRERYGVELTAEAADAVVDVKREYILAMFAAVEEASGSVQGYLNESGVSADVLHSLKARVIVKK